MSDHKWERSPAGGSWCKNCGKDRDLIKLDPEASRTCSSLLRPAEKAPENPTAEQLSRGAAILASLKEPPTTTRQQHVENVLENVLRSKGFVPLSEVATGTEYTLADRDWAWAALRDQRTGRISVEDTLIREVKAARAELEEHYRVLTALAESVVAAYRGGEDTGGAIEDLREHLSKSKK